MDARDQLGTGVLEAGAPSGDGDPAEAPLRPTLDRPAIWAAVLVIAALCGAGGAWRWASGSAGPALVRAEARAGATADGADDAGDESRSSGRGKPERAAPPGVTRLINLNEASSAELQMLPGIGPALAQRIIDEREQHGRFAKVADLDRVRGIGPKTIEKVRAMVCVE